MLDSEMTHDMPCLHCSKQETCAFIPDLSLNAQRHISGLTFKCSEFADPKDKFRVELVVKHKTYDEAREYADELAGAVSPCGFPMTLQIIDPHGPNDIVVSNER